MKNFFSYSEYLQESQRGTLYSDDNPKDTIKDLHYGTGKESEESVQKLESFYKQKKISHQRAVATANTMHNRAKFHANPNVGIKAGEKVWKEYLEKLKRRTQELHEKKSPFKKETLLKYRTKYNKGQHIPFAVKNSLIGQGMIPHEGGPDKGRKKRTEYYKESKILPFDEFVAEKKGPCWPGYKQVGTKKKNGRTVPNCVPVG